MCGIAAIFRTHSCTVELSTAIRQMIEVIKHRGPDDEGFALVDKNEVNFCFGDDTPENCREGNLAYSPKQSLASLRKATQVAALGHRRLSILDLSHAGHQPMSAFGNRYLLAFNGEVYNFIELRAELERLGSKFVSKTDTEVVLHAYRHWGRDCLKRFNGMFAFVLIDTVARTIFVARDRFGIKPLYFWRSPAGFLAFASEIKQFLGLAGWRATLNGRRAIDYLNWGQSDHTDETLFLSVRQLRGGEYLEASFDDLNLDVQPRRWYHLSSQRCNIDAKEAAQTFQQLFTDSVRLRLRADVPTGTCLSGGLDSSSIACTVNRINADIETHAQPGQMSFSSCSEIPRFDEREYINEVLKMNDITPHWTFPKLDSLFETLDRILWHQDEPFLSTSIYAEWEVFKLVRSAGVRVTLDGHGADEQLAGYHTFHGPLLANLFQRMSWVKLAREIQALRRRHGYSFGYSAQKIVAGMLPNFALQPLLRMTGRPTERQTWLNPDRLYVGNIRSDETTGKRSASVSDLAHMQLTRGSIPKQLHWADRDSMAHSIECRVPFLDHRLVEFVMSLPDQLRISGGVTKVVLRNAMKGILPDRIRNRVDKMGFVTPLEVWIREHDPNIFRKYVREAIDQSQGIIREDFVNITEGIIAGTRRYDNTIWRAICFSKWMDTFSVQS